jgi:hypothetical protein
MEDGDRAERCLPDLSSDLEHMAADRGLFHAMSRRITTRRGALAQPMSMRRRSERGREKLSRHGQPSLVRLSARAVVTAKAA